MKLSFLLVSVTVIFKWQRAGFQCGCFVNDVDWTSGYIMIGGKFDYIYPLP